MLIVEDESSVQSLLSRFASNCGYGTTVANNCKEILDKVAQTQFDIILLDVNLPDGSGLEVIPEMRLENPEAKIVVMTGENSRELEAEARERKIFYYLVKPFSLRELYAVFHYAKKDACLEFRSSISTQSNM